MSKTMSKAALKQQRLADVNAVIKAIATHGRRFFYYGGGERRDKDGNIVIVKADRTGYMELRRGRVYFIDEYTEKAIYTHDTNNIRNKWRGFHHGGTLRQLVELMRDYVMIGETIHPGYIGLERSYSDGDIWGYGKEAIAAVNADIKGSPVFMVIDAKEAA